VRIHGEHIEAINNRIYDMDVWRHEVLRHFIDQVGHAWNRVPAGKEKKKKKKMKETGENFSYA
jgi:ferritin-like protein